MKNRLLQLVAAVPELVVGDVAFNTERILEMIRENADSALIVFPELSVTGYTCADLFLSDLLLQESEEALFVIADALGSYLAGQMKRNDVASSLQGHAAAADFPAISASSETASPVKSMPIYVIPAASSSGRPFI